MNDLLLSFGFMEDIPEAAQYKEQTVQLQAGDSALLFSDGAF